MTFKDPDSDADTNIIENLWFRAKKSLPSYGSRHNHIESYNDEIPMEEEIQGGS